MSLSSNCKNSPRGRHGNELVLWLVTDLYPRIKENPKTEALVGNTDSGVG